MRDTIVDQDNVGTSMAGALESLASHYEQMDAALKDTEAGETLGEEDLQRELSLRLILKFSDVVSEMYRDVEELPVILSELEEGGRMIDAHQ
jgi:autophagy-related protein 17